MPDGDAPMPEPARDRDLIAEALIWIDGKGWKDYPEASVALALVALAEETRQARLDTKKHRTEARAESRRQHAELMRVLGRIRR